MPFVKGQPRPLNAGRKKGTPNKKTLERMAREDAAKLLEAKALENDLPLDYMLRVMRDPAVEPHRRDAAAKAAAPYVHPTLAAVAHKQHLWRGSLDRYDDHGRLLLCERFRPSTFRFAAAAPCRRPSAP